MPFFSPCPEPLWFGVLTAAMLLSHGLRCGKISSLGRENLFPCFEPPVGFGGQTVKLLCFLISEFHQGNRTNMSMKCLRGHVEFLMKRGLFWRIATASESVRLLWLHSPNNKFWCTRSILEVFILEERSVFCVPATSDMKMQASLRRIRVRHESHYLHEHTVIVRQSSTEKCNYATFNSQRAAVELGRQLQMLSLHELYRKIVCIVQLHHEYFIILSKSYFQRHFCFPSLKLPDFSSLLHCYLMILWKHIIKFFINTPYLSRVFVNFGIGKCLSTLLSTHFNYKLTTRYGPLLQLNDEVVQ